MPDHGLTLVARKHEPDSPAARRGQHLTDGPAELRFQLLGPVQAWQGAKELALGSPQQRAVLAILLLREGEIVAVDELVDGLWGMPAPRSALGTIRTYICRLRQVLPATAPFDITSIAGGYRLLVPQGALDVHHLRLHVDRARSAWRRSDLATAAGELRTGLALAHGRPLMGTVGPYLDHQRLALEQLVAGATEDRCAIAIEQGRHHEVISELTAAVATHPLRERPRILLMTALYRNGQPADALAQYQKARALFNEELGMEPGEGLRAIHRRILIADPDLSKPAVPSEKVRLQ